MVTHSGERGAVGVSTDATEIEPILSNVARAPDAVVGMVNPRDDPVLVERFEVSSVRKFVVCEDGVFAESVDGFMGNDELLAWLNGDENG